MKEGAGETDAIDSKPQRGKSKSLQASDHFTCKSLGSNTARMEPEQYMCYNYSLYPMLIYIQNADQLEVGNGDGRVQRCLYPRPEQYSSRTLGCEGSSTIRRPMSRVRCVHTLEKYSAFKRDKSSDISYALRMTTVGKLWKVKAASHRQRNTLLT